jgi:hypothetical protein
MFGLTIDEKLSALVKRRRANLLHTREWWNRGSLQREYREIMAQIDALLDERLTKR